MDSIFERQSIDKTFKDEGDGDRSIDMGLNRKTATIDENVAKTNEERKNIKPRVSVRRDLVRRDAMGRKIDESKRPLTNQAKAMPGPTNYSVNYSVLHPNVSGPLMVEPLNLPTKCEKKFHSPLYNVREQLVWNSKGFTFKGKDIRKETISHSAGPADYYVKEFSKKIGPSISGRSKSAFIVNNSPGPKYSINYTRKNSGFSITGKPKISMHNKDFPSPAHYKPTKKSSNPGGVLSNRHNHKIIGDNCSPGPIYKPNIFSPIKSPTIKGRYKSPYTHSSRSPGPQSYFITYNKSERGPSYSLTPKPFPETSKDKFPGPADYHKQDFNKKNLGPSLKGKYIELKLQTIKPGPADYVPKQHDRASTAIVNKRLEMIDNRISNPSPCTYDIDRTCNYAPAFTFGLRWSIGKKFQKHPGPASYFPKELKSTKKISIKGKANKNLTVSNCSPGPIYNPKTFNCSKNVIGISLSSRHSPWVFSPIKRY